MGAFCIGCPDIGGFAKNDTNNKSTPPDGVTMPSALRCVQEWREHIDCVKVVPLVEGEYRTCRGGV